MVFLFNLLKLLSVLLEMVINLVETLALGPELTQLPGISLGLCLVLLLLPQHSLSPLLLLELVHQLVNLGLELPAVVLECGILLL